MNIKGFKAMDKNFKCRDFQFKVGETYSITTSIELCKNGFHFCENAFDVYTYYPKQADTIVCEVEALGEVLKEGDKSVTNKIKIIRQLTDLELLNLWINRTNSGHYNSGHYNSGYYNSGNRNSGNSNSGNYNSGNCNSGHYNSGYYNSGDYNSGHYNSGHYNSGHYNSGHYNSGHYNSGYYNSGFFNTSSPKVRLFNKDTNLTFDSTEAQKLRNLNVKPILSWIPSNSMTEQEKQANPSHATTGGFLRNSGRISWDSVTKEDFEFIKSLPNFDAEVFKQISGIDLSQPKTITVAVNGQSFEVDVEKAKELGLIK